MTDLTVNAQLNKAQRLLSRGDFWEARDILLKLDHPEARRVLAELDDFFPEAPTRIGLPPKAEKTRIAKINWIWVGLAVIGVLSVILFLLVISA